MRIVGERTREHRVRLDTRRNQSNVVSCFLLVRWRRLFVVVVVVFFFIY
jgi:hypothetical protein